jgi:hypothetical protein
VTEISVLELPWPHNPYRCGLVRPFRERHPAFDGMDTADAQRLFGDFIESRAAEARECCPYHFAGVARANQLAVKAHRAGVAVDELTESETEEIQSLAWSFFAHPISWNRSTSELTDGQHRACALRLSDARSCLVHLIR